MDIAGIYCEAVRVQEIIASGRSSLDDCLDASSRREIRRTLGDLLFKLYRNCRLYDGFIADNCSKRPDPGIRRLLYAAFTQIWFRSGVAPEVACNGAVESAKMLFGKKCSGFVNWLLRKAVISPVPDGKHLPPAVEKRWKRFWGSDTVKELDKLFAASPEFRFFWRRRKNMSVPPPAGAVSADPGFQCPVEFFAAPKDGITLDDLAVELQNKNIYIQDPATAFFASFALPAAGDEVLDMCAAPGGKSLLLYDLVPGIKLTSCDRAVPRFRRLQENCLGTEIKCIAADAAELAAVAGNNERFDYILADLPCSNMGVFRSRPDALWRQAEGLDMTLVELQKKLVSAACLMLKPSGSLVLSTCSIDPEENDALAGLLVERGFKVSPHLLFPSGNHDGAWCCIAEKAVK